MTPLDVVTSPTRLSFPLDGRSHLAMHPIRRSASRWSWIPDDGLGHAPPAVMDTGEGLRVGVHHQRGSVDRAPRRRDQCHQASACRAARGVLGRPGPGRCPEPCRERLLERRLPALRPVCTRPRAPFRRRPQSIHTLRRDAWSASAWTERAFDCPSPLQPKLVGGHPRRSPSPLGVRLRGGEPGHPPELIPRGSRLLRVPQGGQFSQGGGDPDSLERRVLAYAVRWASSVDEIRDARVVWPPRFQLPTASSISASSARLRRSTTSSRSQGSRAANSIGVILGGGSDIKPSPIRGRFALRALRGSRRPRGATR